ncbi:TPA: DUF2786 domain-containing protein, partial [Escherichia coli]|nr:DUF2786 domain-containing protein [Escherichia coli]HDJ0695445.1 DUF2786 domain-containing protein [Escherichia coli]
MSDMSHQERLIRRVRKLLELSRNNSNAHEAGLALARAQQLMAKHGITEQDAGLSSVQTSSSQGAPSDAEKVPAWMFRLVMVVTQTFGCRAYYDWRAVPGGRYRRCVTFYGFSERPQVAAYAFDVLCRQLREATDAYLRTQSRRLKLSTRRARAAQFRDGWVQGIRQVVMPFSVTEEESRLMRLWMEQQDMVTVDSREMKACRG